MDLGAAGHIFISLLSSLSHAIERVLLFETPCLTIIPLDQLNKYCYPTIAQLSECLAPARNRTRTDLHNEIRTSRHRLSGTLDALRLVRRPVACQRPYLHERERHAKGKRGHGQRQGQQRADEESAPDRTLRLKRRRKDVQDVRRGQGFLRQGGTVRGEVHCVGKGQVVESRGD